ncbi:MAG TPA: hypothetical protein VGC90_08200 [Candidatus Limnocylindrales bacterium]
MTEPFATFGAAELEHALRDLAPSVAYPSASPAFATNVTDRIAGAGHLTLAGGLRRRGIARVPRPVWRAVLLAAALILIVVAAAGALGLGLPGIRLILGPPPIPTPSDTPQTSRPSATASASATPLFSAAPGDRLGLGSSVSLAEAAIRAGFPVRLPRSPLVGAPDAAYVDATKANQVSLAWRPGPRLPATSDPTVGLLLGEFDGHLDEGFITKAIGTGTTVQNVRVGNNRGFWISGDPHFFFYQGPDGQVVEDSRRWVGDTLIWSDGPMTYRLEGSVGRDAAIAIAESLR